MANAERAYGDADRRAAAAARASSPSQERPEEAVAGADWIQESVPERLDLKRKRLQRDRCRRTTRMR